MIYDITVRLNYPLSELHKYEYSDMLVFMAFCNETS